MRILFFLCLIGLVQFYLIEQLKLGLPKWISSRPLREAVLALFTAAALGSLLPLLWRNYSGLRSDVPYFQSPETIFMLSGIWWAGSAGCAAVLVLCNAFGKFLERFTPAKAVTAPDFERRAFLRKTAGVAAVAPFMISGYGGLVERRRFEIDHFDVPIDGLSSSLSQITIAQLSDIHVGPFMSEEELNEYVDAVNRLKPDLIALTGDFVTGRRSEVSPCLEALSRLKARLGIFACLGNHDIYAGASRDLMRGFGERDIRMLRNDAVTLEVGNSTLAILGIDDIGRGRPSLRDTLDARNRPAEVNVLLSHRPEIFPRAARQGIDLVLSGHYHGGQIKLFPDPEAPSIARFMTSYADGFFTLDGADKGADFEKRSTLFVSRGIGVTALPIRINCPPQIAHLRLTKG